MITLKSYLMGRESKYPLNETQLENAKDLIERLSKLEKQWGEPLILTSGYRPKEINAQTLHAAPMSSHQSCQGSDLHDPLGRLSNFLLGNLTLLETLGLWMESPQSAKDHVHLQSRPPKSGRRVFIA